MKISPAPLGGKISAIPSKSQAHRALICAALADKPTRIICRGTSKDIAATLSCLSALGALIESDEEGYTVNPLRREQSDDAASLCCGESGSTFRFLLPVTAALGRSASFMPQGRLPERPLSPLYEELVRHGCALSPEGSVPFLTGGQLLPGSYALNAGVSSQFVSGLLFALPLLDGDSELRLIGRAESFPYIGMTLSMLRLFGIETVFDGEFFSIPGGQIYRSPGVLSVEGDWSNAAFWLCAGAMSEGGITCAGLDFNSRQGDRAVTEILSRMGAKIEQTGGDITVSRGKLRGAEIDARDIPDLVPVLTVVCAAADGVSVIGGAGRLRLKESDRLSAVTSVMRCLGADIDEREDGLTIRGTGRLSGGTVSSWGDHRIAMATSVAASVCAESPVVIENAGAVDKSYPGFFRDLASLGGSVRIIEERGL